MSEREVCAVVGVGPGNGMALARRFAADHRHVALLARRADKLAAYAEQLDKAEPFVCDASDPASVTTAFGHIRERLGRVDTLLYNAGSGAWGSLDELEVEALDGALAINARGLFACAKQVVPAMREAGGGVIGVVGATASLRGKPKTLAFAAGKAAQRSVAQSLARQLGPEGIHVYLAIIDGMINLESTRARMADKPGEDFMEPGDIAEAMWRVARQPRSAWTFELDLRPFKERW